MIRERPFIPHHVRARCAKAARSSRLVSSKARNLLDLPHICYPQFIHRGVLKRIACSIGLIRERPFIPHHVRAGCAKAARSSLLVSSKARNLLDFPHICYPQFIHRGVLKRLDSRTAIHPASRARWLRESSTLLSPGQFKSSKLARQARADQARSSSDFKRERKLISVSDGDLRLWIVVCSIDSDPRVNPTFATIVRLRLPR